MEVVGYAIISKTASTGTSAISIDEFRGETVRVFEFAPDGGVLVINAKATGLAMFDKEDVKAKFECSLFPSPYGDVICPPEMKNDFLKKAMYATRVTSRKGGYNNLLKQMIIHASLHKGKFNDHLLWAKQMEEDAAAEQQNQKNNI